MLSVIQGRRGSDSHPLMYPLSAEAFQSAVSNPRFSRGPQWSCFRLEKCQLTFDKATVLAVVDLRLSPGNLGLFFGHKAPVKTNHYQADSWSMQPVRGLFVVLMAARADSQVTPALAICLKNVMVLHS